MLDADLLTTGEAAALLGSSRQHVVNLCDRGLLPNVTIGTHRRLRRTDVEALSSPVLTRDQERSLWLHHVVAGRLAADPDAVIVKARTNLDLLDRQHAGSPASRWVEQWRQLLDGSVRTVLEVLVSRAEHAVELRQNSPFAGVLSEPERRHALAAFREHWTREHAT